MINLFLQKNNPSHVLKNLKKKYLLYKQDKIYDFKPINSKLFYTVIIRFFLKKKQKNKKTKKQTIIFYFIKNLLLYYL